MVRSLAILCMFIVLQLFSILEMSFAIHSTHVDIHHMIVLVCRLLALFFFGILNEIYGSSNGSNVIVKIHSQWWCNCIKNFVFLFKLSICVHTFPIHKKVRVCQCHTCGIKLVKGYSIALKAIILFVTISTKQIQVH